MSISFATKHTSVGLFTPVIKAMGCAPAHVYTPSHFKSIWNCHNAQQSDNWLRPTWTHAATRRGSSASPTCPQAHVFTTPSLHIQTAWLEFRDLIWPQHNPAEISRSICFQQQHRLGPAPVFTSKRWWPLMQDLCAPCQSFHYFI